MYHGVLFLLGKNAARLFRDGFAKRYNALDQGGVKDSEAYLIEKNKRRIAVRAFRAGIPRAREAVPEYIREGGEFVTFGYAGGGKDFDVGDIVLPHVAILSKRNIAYLCNEGEEPSRYTAVSNERMRTVVLSGKIKVNKLDGIVPKEGSILSYVPDEALRLFGEQEQKMRFPETSYHDLMLSSADIKFFGPMCCDMETAYLMIKAREANKPVASVIVISDNSGNPMTHAPDPEVPGQKLMALPNKVVKNSKIAMAAALDTLLIDKN